MGTIIAIGAGLAVLAGAGAGIGIGIATSFFILFYANIVQENRER